jgi:Asp-tRNA(Asn)/Glu-tRNA(Gln) amidotransferase A subunit family amidase
VETHGQDCETVAFLAMARKLRRAQAQRAEVVRPYLERYDRAQDDLRMVLERRGEIAQEFLQAAYRADHVYDEHLNQAAEELRTTLQDQGRSG